MESGGSEDEAVGGFHEKSTIHLKFVSVETSQTMELSE